MILHKQTGPQAATRASRYGRTSFFVYFLCGCDRQFTASL